MLEYNYACIWRWCILNKNLVTVITLYCSAYLYVLLQYAEKQKISNHGSRNIAIYLASALSLLLFVASDGLELLPSGLFPRRDGKVLPQQLQLFIGVVYTIASGIA